MTYSDYISVAGVIANLLVVLVAILVPVWQRRSMLNDAVKSEQRALNRFIEAFRVFASALDALIEAGKMERPAKAFEAVESKLRGATEALTEASAAPLPIKAVVNSTMAQQKATAILAHFPELKLYGSNLMTYGSLQAEISTACDEVHELLRQTETLIARQTKNNSN